jgi:hypothetical protein
MTIKEYLNGKIWYEDFGQILWLEHPEKGAIMIAELRGWSAIKSLFKTTEDAEEFQDSIGKFIEEAIREKLEKL